MGGKTVMKISKRNNFICILLSICFVISWLSFSISGSQSMLSNSTPDESYTYYCINDALPASVSGRSENNNLSFFSKLKDNTNSSMGFGWLFAIVACIFTGCFFAYFSSRISVNAGTNLSSHHNILNYIHKQDGKK